MPYLQKDIKERSLGKKHHICRVCGAEGEFPSYLVREMMQGTKDEFEYFACENCDCLQIAQVPENLGDYYGESYYSFALKEEADYQYENPVANRDKMLDVGCGSGAWLFGMAQAGCGNLYGCDPFLEHDIQYGDRVHIRKCAIYEMEGEGSFDVIRMADSFEHVTDPLETLQSAHRLLKPFGVLTMTLPTYPNIAFEMFGSHWYQLDAPRHIFLHSIKSLEILGQKSRMKIVKAEYNSNRTQFIRSFFYQHGVPFWDQKQELVSIYFSGKDMEKMDGTSQEANRNGYGDHVKVSWMRED